MIWSLLLDVTDVVVVVAGWPFDLLTVVAAAVVGIDDVVDVDVDDADVECCAGDDSDDADDSSCSPIISYWCADVIDS